MDGKTLRVSGFDIEWEKVELNTEQIVAENIRVVDQIVESTLM
ncbi:hypothetical protein [Paenibacillus terrae]|nr:hypothetical protein [Paenibacillus terrae]